MYTPEQLTSLIAEVEKEFTSHLAKAQEDFNLAKSEEGSDKKDKSKDQSKPPEAKKPEEEKPEDKGVKDQDQQKEGAAPFAAKEGEKPAEGEAPSADMPPEGQAPAEGHNYDEEDMAHLEQMYSSMSPAELKAHHDCIRKCMDAGGLAKCEDVMAKSEKDVVIEIAPEVSLLKSELEAAKAEGEANKKNLEAVESFLKKFVERTAPAGKAITSLDVIAKTESGQKEKPLSKSEIDAKLLAKAKDPTLTKSDKDAITSFYFNKNVESVRHLLN